MYQIRPGYAGDLPWLDEAVAAGTWESLSPEQRQKLLPGMAAQQARLQLRQVLSAPGSTLIVAQLNQQPVGYLLVAVVPDGSTEEPTALLLDLWVHPAHRRRRVGSGLLAAAERWVASLGVKKMKLWTGLHHRTVVDFAQRVGFAPAGLIGVKDL
jgi:GNAT superfamily N-acetyltransferase